MRRKMKSCLAVSLVIGLSWMNICAGDEKASQGIEGKRPSILILPSEKLDYTYLNELHGKGFDIDFGLDKDKPLDWDRLKKFNCLVLTAFPNPPQDKAHQHGMHDPWRFPPFRDEFGALLDRFLAAGGGVLVLLDTADTNTSPSYETNNMFLGKWGAKLPLEGLNDPVTETNHPHSNAPFIFTDKILPSPVSEGVKGIWYPSLHRSGNSNFHTYGQAIEVDKDWTVVLRGSDSSYSEALKPGFALRENEKFTPYVREGKIQSPILFAVRDFGGGRIGLGVLNEVFHLASGTTWAHDRVMLGKGMAKRPGDFNILIENTMRWLSQPSLEKGTLGGYQQDPLVLKHPHFHKAPAEYFPLFDSYQNPVPGGQVFKGLVGAQSALSKGKGTVEEYAAAAKKAGLDFIVFLEEFTELTEDELRQLDKDCLKFSGKDIALIPGYTMRTNLGNHIFFIGYDLAYPKGNQLGGKDGKELRLQCFDDKGLLTYNDEAAKNLLWANASGKRNIGYFNFKNSDSGSVPVRNLRLYGMLGAVTYLDGKFVEDVTDEYLKLTPQGNPPRMCSVNIIGSPDKIQAELDGRHYLTYVAAEDIGKIMDKMVYGHQYGRDNAYPSNGPKIHAWSGNHRVTTFAGEPFVPSRYLIPHLAQVSSDAGLREIRIYSDGKLFRRFLLDGAKEFKQVFQWSFDRQRGMVLEAVDVDGGRAVSTSFETWSDTNAMSWCSDRQNGELWHGPFQLCSVWQSGVLVWYSIGKTWDGGGALTPFSGINFRTHPGLTEKDGKSESMPGGFPRPMEGYTYATCVDDSVRNIAGEAWNVYDPGAIGNAYHTLGPIKPAEQMSFKIRRTMYLPRVVGPLMDWHAMWSERSGGGTALFEGEMTLKKDMEPREILAGALSLVNFDEKDRIPMWAIRGDSNSNPVCGTRGSIIGPGIEIRKELGQSDRTITRLPLGRGGYVATFGVDYGNPSAIFNVGDGNLEYEPGHMRIFLADLPEKAKAGDKFTWRLFYVWDSFEHDARNLARVEKIKSYFGLDGKTGSGIDVKRGRLVSHLGLVDLAPENGITEFVVPEPAFNFDVPLCMRFIGFNPNWTVGQLQITGYSPGFYSNGNNVYRNLATDDRDMVHLAVYTKGVPKSHSVVGHPVQCDAKDMIIEVTQLNDKPERWHVAVNNPTDKPIKTTLRKCMDLPGFDFPDKEIEVAPGGYQVVLDQLPPPPPERVSVIKKRPDFIAQVPRENGGKALRISMNSFDKVAHYQAGACAKLKEELKSENAKEPYHVIVKFDARLVDGAPNLVVSRPWGGSSQANFKLTKEWKEYSGVVEGDPRFTSSELFFTLSDGSTAANGTCEIDNVLIQKAGKDGKGTGENLAVNGSFDEDLKGWDGTATTWENAPSK